MPPQQKYNNKHMYEEDSCSSESTVSFQSSPVPKRRIRFALTENQVHLIPHINDLSDQEVKETWYDRSDYEKIKMALIPIVRKMMKGERIEENNRQTIRGLEYRTRDGAIRRQHNKAEAISAVMDEQDRQLDLNGRTDSEILRQVYSQINAHCQREAHELALGDVEPAREHCADVYQKMVVAVEHILDEREPPVRKSSFSKLFKQMRIRRRAPVYEPNAVDSVDRQSATILA